MDGAGSHDPSNPPAADSFPAVYLDGLTNRKHRVTVKPSAALEIAGDGVFLAAWAYGDIRRADGPKNILRLRNIAAAKLARLEIGDPSAQAELLRLCKLLDGEGAVGNVSTARIVFWSLAAAASLLAVTWFGVPFIAARLTGLVPLSLEKRRPRTVESMQCSAVRLVPAPKARLPWRSSSARCKPKPNCAYRRNLRCWHSPFRMLSPCRAASSMS